MTQDLFTLYQGLHQQKVFLAFKGAISQDILVELGEILKNKLILDKKVKKVFAVFIEMAQNVLHYSAEREFIGDSGTQAGVGLVVVTESCDCYLVSSCNLTEFHRAQRLKSQCDTLNSSSEEDLKRFYTEQRKGVPSEGSKGAGLGLIDMARKSDRPLQYSIHPINENHSLFTLTVTLEKGK